jgi:hypothetical protein
MMKYRKSFFMAGPKNELKFEYSSALQHAVVHPVGYVGEANGILAAVGRLILSLIVNVVGFLPAWIYGYNKRNQEELDVINARTKDIANERQPGEIPGAEKENGAAQSHSGKKGGESTVNERQPGEIPGAERESGAAQSHSGEQITGELSGCRDLVRRKAQKKQDMTIEDKIEILQYRLLLLSKVVERKADDVERGKTEFLLRMQKKGISSEERSQLMKTVMSLLELELSIREISLGFRVASGYKKILPIVYDPDVTPTYSGVKSVAEKAQVDDNIINEID